MGRLRYLNNARTGTGGTIVEGASKLQFFNDDSYIYASEAGVLNVVAGTELVLEATTITLNGAFAFSGTDSLALGTNAAPLTLTAGSPLFTLYTTTSNTTSTNAEPFYVKSVVTGIGGYGGRSRFHTYSNVASGTNIMALKAHMEFGLSGSATGLAAAFCAELVMPNATPVGMAGYAVLELEYVASGTSTTTYYDLGGSFATFLIATNSGDANGDFDDHGFLMVFKGLTDATTHVWYDNTLRIGVGTATWYLPMSSAEASYTTAYPIVTTYATNAIDISTCAIGINFSGTPTIGINMPGGGADYTPILIGEKTNLADGGFKVAGSGDDSGGIQVYADDSGDAAAGEVISPFRVRYLLSVGQTGGVTQTGLFAQMRTLGTTGAPLVLNTGSWRTSYVFSQLGGNTIQGGAEITGMNQATTLAGNMIVTSGSFTGIDINIAGSGTITNNSVCAALLIRSKETPVWTNGIQIADAGALTGIAVGTCTTANIAISGTNATGIALTGTYSVAGISITHTDATGGLEEILIASTFTKNTAIAHKAISSTCTYQPTGDSGTGVPIAVAGMTVLGEGATHSGLYMWGVQGGLKFLATSVVSDSQSAAGRFVLEEAGAVTYTSGNIACIYCDNLITSPMASESTGQIDLMRIANHGGLMDNAINVYGPNLTNLFYLGGCTNVGCVGADIGATAIHKTVCRPIKISIDGTAYYLIASTAYGTS